MMEREYGSRQSEFNASFLHPGPFFHKKRAAEHSKSQKKGKRITARLLQRLQSTQAPNKQAQLSQLAKLAVTHSQMNQCQRKTLRPSMANKLSLALYHHRITDPQSRTSLWHQRTRTRTHTLSLSLSLPAQIRPDNAATNVIASSPTRPQPSTTCICCAVPFLISRIRRILSIDTALSWQYRGMSVQ